MWIFDPLIGDIVWCRSREGAIIFDALYDFEGYNTGDLEMSCGNRTNDESIVDNGQRIIETNN